MLTGQGKKVYQYDLDGNFINEYNSIRETAFFVGVTKSNIKFACEGITIQSNNFYFTFEYRMKLDKDTIPYFKKNTKRIICKFDLNGKYIEHYLSIKEAGIKNNVRRPHISSCLTNDRHMAGGFIWIRNLYRDLTKDELLKYKSYKKVYQYDLDGNFINEFELIIDAANKLKISPTGIWSVLHNHQNIKRYKNFIFSYEKSDKIKSYKRDEHSKSKKVYQYDLDGNFLNEYYSVIKASKETNISSGGISACCLKKPKYYSAGGYIWRHSDNVKNKNKLLKKEIKIPTKEKKVYQYDLNGSFMKEYKSIREASKNVKIKHNTLCMCLNGYTKTSGGYIWKYKKN